MAQVHVGINCQKRTTSIQMEETIGPRKNLIKKKTHQILKKVMTLLPVLTMRL